MDALKLVRLADPILHRKASDVEPGEIPDKMFQKFLDAMVMAMRRYNGVGMAAPQIGIGKRIFACEVRNNLRYPSAPNIPLQIYINPQIIWRSEEDIVLQEGCLSVTDLRGDVPRAAKVRLSALDRSGNPVEIMAEGFLARIFQHECDHLVGHLFLERVRERSSIVKVK